MRLFIAEDEPPARERLIEAIGRVAPGAVVVGCVGSVQASAAWLAAHPAPDLLLLDIQLADGLSLELFRDGRLAIPTIFTTAYDRFALDAFRAVAIDYLLKPISHDALAQAFAKVSRLRAHFGADAATELLARLGATGAQFRQRIVGRLGSRFHALAVHRIAYFVSVDKLCFMVADDGARYRVDTALGELERELDPAMFFRVNRQLLVAAQAVGHFAAIGKGRLKLEFKRVGQATPQMPAQEISQERAAAFRAWLGR